MVKRVAIVRDMLITVPVSKDLFSEIDKLLRLYLIITVTIWTAEISLSLVLSNKDIATNEQQMCQQCSDVA